MKLEASSSIPGLHVINSLRVEDSRGSFLNIFRTANPEYLQSWSSRPVSQINISYNIERGTVRGLHLQEFPHADAKIVRCINGEVWDVVVDLRKDSPAFGCYYTIRLSSKLCNAIFIPEGCAHGFQTLLQDSEVLYLHSASWEPEYETGVRFDDPDLDIPWPLPPMNVSNRDLSLPSFNSL